MHWVPHSGCHGIPYCKHAWMPYYLALSLSMHNGTDYGVLEIARPHKLSVHRHIHSKGRQLYHLICLTHQPEGCDYVIGRKFPDSAKP